MKIFADSPFMEYQTTNEYFSGHFGSLMVVTQMKIFADSRVIRNQSRNEYFSEHFGSLMVVT